MGCVRRRRRWPAEGRRNRISGASSCAEFVNRKQVHIAVGSAETGVGGGWMGQCGRQGDGQEPAEKVGQGGAQVAGCDFNVARG